MSELLKRLNDLMHSMQTCEVPCPVLTHKGTHTCYLPALQLVQFSSLQELYTEEVCAEYTTSS